MNYTLELLELFVLLGVIAYGAYYMKKKVKNQQLKRPSDNEYIQLLDTMNMGMNQSLYLIQVGEENVLLSTGNHGVSMTKLEHKGELPVTSAKTPKDHQRSFEKMMQNRIPLLRK